MTRWYEAKIDIPELEMRFDLLASRYADTVEERDIDAILDYLQPLARALLARCAPKVSMLRGEIRWERTLRDPKFRGWPKALSGDVTYLAGPQYRADVHCDYTVTAARDGDGHTISITLTAGEQSWCLACNCKYAYPHFYIFYEESSAELAALASQTLDQFYQGGLKIVQERRGQ